MTLCKDCAFYVPSRTSDFQTNYDKCRWDGMPASLVTGKPRNLPLQSYCEALRDSKEYCGPEARWFKPKETFVPEREALSTNGATPF